MYIIYRGPSKINREEKTSKIRAALGYSLQPFQSRRVRKNACNIFQMSCGPHTQKGVYIETLGWIPMDKRK